MIAASKSKKACTNFSNLFWSQLGRPVHPHEARVILITFIMATTGVTYETTFSWETSLWKDEQDLDFDNYLKGALVRYKR